MRAVGEGRAPPMWHPPVTVVGMHEDVRRLDPMADAHRVWVHRIVSHGPCRLSENLRR